MAARVDNLQASDSTRSMSGESETCPRRDSFSASGMTQGSPLTPRLLSGALPEDASLIAEQTAAGLASPGWPTDDEASRMATGQPSRVDTLARAESSPPVHSSVIQALARTQDRLKTMSTLFGHASDESPKARSPIAHDIAHLSVSWKLRAESAEVYP